MKLSILTSQYVAYKQAMGMRFHTEARTLQSFCRAMGDISIADIAADRVNAYIAGVGPVTRFWHRKYEVLRGFYRFAIARGYAASAPLPNIIPKAPQFVPYIFSHEELQRLLDASAYCANPRCKLQPYTCRMLILLLYGAALRISEALSLMLADVDLTADLLTIRESKFYKTRLVPMSPSLTSAVSGYVTQRAKEHSIKSDSALFLTRQGTPLARYTAENIFRRLRVRAGVLRHDGGRYQPRLHDLRHTAAVHRVVSWYRQGAEVQRLLPQLATYLGHVNIAATQRYLTMTPELLQEASQRFEHFAQEASMNDRTLLGPWVRRFLLEHLVAERNLARNTQCSYRDALTLLIPFVADRLHQSVDRLTLVDLSADLVRLFLADLEQSRQCTIASRNQRLTAIHALARFVGEHSPEHIAWCGQIRSIPFKKVSKAVIPSLDKPEMDTLLNAPDCQTAQGRRDHTLLLFLYNSGARAEEAAHLLIGDLDVAGCSVKIRGKGGKQRLCPLWPSTIEELKALIISRSTTAHVFLNRCARPITRFGIYALVRRYVRQVQMTSLAAKRVSPHTIRHTTATHLLRAGVDINTIRAWLGHVSIDTTNIYAEMDLEMKAKALAKCEVTDASQPRRHWRDDPGLMTFLRSL